jgi:hypothetical protein
MGQRDDLLKEILLRLEERQNQMNSILERNTTLLAEHIRRTDILEAELKPVKAHVQLMNNVAKVVGVVVGGLVAGNRLGLF